MKYRIEISGGFAGLNTILEGELTKNDSLLQKALLSEKNMIKVNPKLRDGYLYKIYIEAGRRKKQEFLFDETNLPNSLKGLIEFAQRKKVA